MSKRPRAEPSGSGADGPSGWRVSLPDDGVAVLCMAATGTLALGLHAGAIALLTERGLESRRLDGHAGGTLALATSTASDGRNYLVSAGADGCVRIWSVETGAQLSAHPLDGGTRGVHGCLVDTLSVSGPLWAAAMGRCARVGAVDGAAAVAVVACLGPHTHAIDAVCWVEAGGGGAPAAAQAQLAVASFGGVTLWRRVGGDEAADSSAAAAPPRFERVGSLPACRSSPLATLSFEGWPRTLTAAPGGGGWLAASASLAVDEPQHVRLWRMSDGADFVCAGHTGQVRALCWSADARLLASCSGATAAVWRFRPSQGGPAGTPPLRCAGPAGATLSAAAFAPARDYLACGASDGSLSCFEVQPAAGAGGGPARRGWRAEGVRSDDAVEHVAWSHCGALVIACYASGLVAGVPFRELRRDRE